MPNAAKWQRAKAIVRSAGRARCDRLLTGTRQSARFVAMSADTSGRCVREVNALTAVNLDWTGIADHALASPKGDMPGRIEIFVSPEIVLRIEVPRMLTLAEGGR